MSGTSIIAKFAMSLSGLDMCKGGNLFLQLIILSMDQLALYF